MDFNKQRLEGILKDALLSYEAESIPDSGIDFIQTFEEAKVPDYGLVITMKDKSEYHVNIVKSK